MSSFFPKSQSSAWFPWVVCGLGALFYTYEYFLRISPSVMTTDLMRSFGVSAGTFGNLIGFYYYAYTPAQLLVGVVMDRYGPRRLLTLACLVCAVGAYLFASAGRNDLALVAIGRFLMGFGSAFAFVGVLKLATIWLPADRFALAAGLTSALGTVGAMFGEVAMSRLVQSLGWRPTIFVAAALGVVLAVMIALFVRDGTKEAQELDSRDSIDFARVFAGLVQLLKHRQIWLNGAVGCLLYLPTTVFAELWGHAFFQTVYGFSSNTAALAISMIFFGFTVGGPVNGLISDKIKQRRLPLCTAGIIAASIISLILYVPVFSEPVLYLLLFLFGATYSAQVIVFAVGRELSSNRTSATAIAITNACVMFGGLLFQPLVGLFLDHGWQGKIVNNVHVYAAQTYQHALIILPVGLLLASVCAYFLKETFPEAET
jgi:MFS family permease